MAVIESKDNSVVATASFLSFFSLQDMTKNKVSAVVTRMRLVFFMIVLLNWFRIEVELLYLMHLWLGPRTVQCSFVRPVKAHVSGKRSFRCGQPVRFLVLSWGFVLDVDRESAIGIFLHIWKHR